MGLRKTTTYFCLEFSRQVCYRHFQLMSYSSFLYFQLQKLLPWALSLCVSVFPPPDHLLFASVSVQLQCSFLFLSFLSSSPFSFLCLCRLCFTFGQEGTIREAKPLTDRVPSFLVLPFDLFFLCGRPKPLHLHVISALVIQMLREGIHQVITMLLT